MWLKAQIVTFGFFVLALPVYGQDSQSSATSVDSYRERLKAMSADSDDVKGRSDGDARESYKERLRRLAQGNEEIPQSTRTQSESAKENVEQRQTGDEVDKNSDVLSNTQSQNQKAGMVQRVAIANSVGQNSAPPAAKTSPAPPEKTCRDQYCEQLRQIANGSPEQPHSSDMLDGQTITTEKTFVKNLAFDQLHIWESPFKLRDYDATWAIPFGIITGTLVDTDRDTSKQLATPGRLDISKQISDAGLYGMIGAGAGFYGLGVITHDDHERETGLLSGEAFINATLLAESLKLAFGRQRPFEGDGFGHIGKGGSSFPSEHAIGTFAIASVVAREYPNPFVEIGAYGLASAVSFARVTAGQHFPSDVFVGGVLGYFIGRKIYNDHHNPDLGGAEYGTFVHEHQYDAAHSGSAYVPLESWVYPVIDRLAALGYVHSNFDSERPWTRLECARIAGEAAGNTRDIEVSTDIQRMIDALQREFLRESEVSGGGTDNRSAELESVYTRATEIVGPVLRDGYHFGQTIYDDYGRPYGRGFNEITGFSARATSGPLVFYFRGEYQHAPGNPNYTDQQKSAMFLADDQTPVVDNRFPAAQQFQVLDAYIGLNFGNNLLSLGQQSLWWGPGSGGAFMFTNNAVPLKMLRLNRVSPTEIPLLSRFLGPFRYDMFLGQTDGYTHILTPSGLLGPQLGTQPFVQGQRFTFKPTPNFEFGLTKTGIFGGSGYPLTAGYLFRTTFTTANYDAGASRKPGDRRSGVDVTYRVPGLRDWLTWYAEEFSEDEVSPLFFPRTSAMRSGIYAARIPGLHGVDLRVEGQYTDVPNYPAKGYFYFNATYKDGFTNFGNIMGDWIGRQGRGINATSTIWYSAKDSLQFGYREAAIANDFLEGGHYHDESVTVNFSLMQNFAISSMLQYEQWRFPLLAPGQQNNFVSSLQITYRPIDKK